MKLNIVDDYAALSRAGAQLVAAAIREKLDLKLLVPTGNTPLGLYSELAELKAQDDFDAGGVTVFQLDEYVGISEDDERSLYGWMRAALLEPLGISQENVVRLHGDATDLDEVCRAYNAAVATHGGFDLALLGLGPNGHLGFNEPGSSASSQTQVIDLTPESVASNTRYWGSSERVPRRALTAGMDALLAAEHVILPVSGEAKRDILERSLRGPIGPEVPASFLQTVPNFTLLADRAAWPH
ncbi:glucosamine-6-phosphate deaminase [soil metagenome]